MLLLAGLIPSAVHAAATWRLNLFRSAGVVFQDPYYTACTAASAMTMLNFMALTRTGGDGFRWTTYRTHRSPDPKQYRDMTSILSFERAHDTLAGGAAGSDAHGWRNALNYYGWGVAAMVDPARRVYDDQAFGSFDAALKGAVVAIARYHKPVGMLGWAGGHSQVISGFVVVGEDPATSTSFTVSGVYLTDPLRSDGYVNRYVTRRTLLAGDVHVRFQSYRQIDSPYDDPYTAGFRRSSVRYSPSEWYRRWVIVAPIRSGLPPANPAPTPTPNPTPTPTPSLEPDPSASAPASDSSASPSDAAPTESPSDAAPTATASPTASPTDAASSASDAPAAPSADAPAAADPTSPGPSTDPGSTGP